MIGISPIHSVDQALSYYAEVDDYYREGGRAPTQWVGSLAREYGLTGEVQERDFLAVMSGQVGDKIVGKDRQMADGTVHKGHRPGYDLTISAPKSVSVQALIGGDRRLIGAHDTAAISALKMAEEHIVSRLRDHGKVARVSGDGLIAAVFRHETSRELEAQLHSHAIVANITEYLDQLRAIDSRELYAVQKMLGEVYQAELAALVQELGYEIERVEHWSEDNKSRWTSFRIVGVPEQVIDAHSTRRKQVVESLRRDGLTTDATGKQRNIRSTGSRKAKAKAVDHDVLREAWKADTGHENLEAMAALQDEAIERSKARNTPQALFDQALEAQRAVAFAAEILGERESTFSRTELVKRSMIESIGTGAKADAVLAAIETALSRGDLENRIAHDKKRHEVPGYTTRQNIEYERSILKLEREGRGAMQPLLDADSAREVVARASESSEYPFNDGQRAATEQLLSADDQFTALQGAAGSAKTTTVIKTMADVAREKGYNVVALATTAAAAQQLRDGAGLGDARTVASFLVDNKNPPNERTIIILDEASLTSTKDAQAVARRVAESGARLLSVGDVHQIGSVAAGRAFAQQQDGGITTARLDAIVRQRTEHSKAVVEAVYENRYSDAIAVLNARDAVTELAAEIPADAKDGEREALIEQARKARYQAAADAYLNRTAEERAATIVIDPTRVGRSAINERIQFGLAAQGELGESVDVVLRDRVITTDAEKKSIHTYAPGDEILFARDRVREGIQGDVAYRVIGTDQRAKTVKIRAADDEAAPTLDWKPGRTAASAVEKVEQEHVALHIGDRIVVAQNDKGRNVNNGDAGRVIGIGGRHVQIALDKGGTIRQDMDRPSHTRMRLAYAMTAHAGQGQTCDHVIAHLQSDRFVDQKVALVALTRARDSQHMVTDSAERLVSTLDARDGEKTQALSKRETAENADRGDEKTFPNDTAALAQQHEKPPTSEIEQARRARPEAEAMDMSMELDNEQQRQQLDVETKEVSNREKAALDKQAIEQRDRIGDFEKAERMAAAALFRNEIEKLLRSTEREQAYLDAAVVLEQIAEKSGLSLEEVQQGAKELNDAERSQQREQLPEPVQALVAERTLSARDRIAADRTLKDAFGAAKSAADDRADVQATIDAEFYAAEQENEATRDLPEQVAGEESSRKGDQGDTRSLQEIREKLDALLETRLREMYNEGKVPSLDEVEWQERRDEPVFEVGAEQERTIVSAREAREEQEQRRERDQSYER